LAIHNYHDVHKAFPLSRSNVWGQPPEIHASFSWISQVLPFMEETSLFNRIDFKATTGAGGGGHSATQNDTARNAVINVLLCPSDASGLTHIEGSMVGIDGGPVTGARTDYVGSMGWTNGGWRDCPIPGNPAPYNNAPWAWPDVNQPVSGCNGVFGYRGATNFSQIADGTSSTLMVLETNHWRKGKFKPAEINDDAIWMNPVAAIATVRNMVNSPFQSPTLNPDDRRCHGWSSNHSGGANAAFSDASVRFVSETIDPNTARAIATRAEKDPIFNSY
jgi:prepilin-type processing-associated H-X9-DG protein